MKLRTLTEEWKDFITLRGKDYSIYKNPTTSDFTALRKEETPDAIRYIVGLYTKKPVLYIFHYQVLHYQAAKHLGIPHKDRVHRPIWGDFGFGTSPLLKNNKMLLDNKIIKEIKVMGIEKDFLQGYFSNI